MSLFDEKEKKREKLFKWLFRVTDQLKSSVYWFTSLCRLIFTLTLILFFASFLFYIGFTNTEENILKLIATFRILFVILFITKFLPELLDFRRKTPVS